MTTAPTVRLFNFQTGQAEDVDETHVSALTQAQSHGFLRSNDPIPMRNAFGEPVLVPPERAGDAAAAGFQYETSQERAEREKQALYGDSDVRTFFERAAGAASFGISDLVLSHFDKEGLRERAERNTDAATAGEIAGTVGSLFIPVGGGLTLGKAAAKASASLAERLVARQAAERAASLGTRALTAGVAGVSEGAALGALQGIQQTVTEQALGAPESAAEMLLQKVGMGAVLGGVLGGGVSAGGELLGAGARAAGATVKREFEAGVPFLPGARNVKALFEATETSQALSALPALSETERAAYLAAQKTIREAPLADKLALAIDNVVASGAQFMGVNKKELQKLFVDPETRAAVVDGLSNESKTHLVDTAQKLVSEVKDQVSDAYEGRLSEMIRKAAGADDAPGALSLKQTSQFQSRMFKQVTDAEKQLAQFPNHYNDNVASATFAQLRDTLSGYSPGDPRLGELMTTVGDLFESIGVKFGTVDAAGDFLTQRPTIGGFVGSLKELTKQERAVVEPALKELQLTAAIQAKKELGATLKKSFQLGASDNTERLLQGVYADFNAQLKDSALMGEFGTAMSAMDDAYRAYKDNFDKLRAAITDRGPDNAVNTKKVLDVVQARGNKGMMVDDLMAQAKDFLAQHGDDDAQAFLGEMARFRELAKQAQAVQNIRASYGPSGQGVAAGLGLTGVLGGTISSGLAAAAYPFVAPFSYLKTLTGLETSVHTALETVLMRRAVVAQRELIADTVVDAVKRLTRQGTEAAGRVGGAHVLSGEESFEERVRKVEDANAQGVENLFRKSVAPPRYQLIQNEVTKKGALMLSALHARIPRPPAAHLPSPIGGLSRNFRPTRQQKAIFNAWYEAAANPNRVIARLGAGTLTRDHVEALHTFYPETYQDVGTAISRALYDRKDVPYASKLQLSTWFGVPTDRTTDPSYRAAVQASLASVNPAVAQAPRASARGLQDLSLGARTQTGLEQSLDRRNQ